MVWPDNQINLKQEMSYVSAFDHISIFEAQIHPKNDGGNGGSGVGPDSKVNEVPELPFTDWFVRHLGSECL